MQGNKKSRLSYGKEIPGLYYTESFINEPVLK